MQILIKYNYGENVSTVFIATMNAKHRHLLFFDECQIMLRSVRFFSVQLASERMFVSILFLNLFQFRTNEKPTHKNKINHFGFNFDFNRFNLMLH